LEKDIFNKEMRKKLRKNTRIIPYEVPACPVCPCPQAGGDRQASGRDNFVSSF